MVRDVIKEMVAGDGGDVPLSIPLYSAPQVTEAREERAGYEANGLRGAISAWAVSST